MACLVRQSTIHRFLSGGAEGSVGGEGEGEERGLGASASRYKVRIMVADSPHGGWYASYDRPSCFSS